MIDFYRRFFIQFLPVNFAVLAREDSLAQMAAFIQEPTQQVYLDQLTALNVRSTDEIFYFFKHNLRSLESVLILEIEHRHQLFKAHLEQLKSDK